MGSGNRAQALDLRDPYKRRDEMYVVPLCRAYGLGRRLCGSGSGFQSLEARVWAEEVPG
jgi:hypothetical protein